jgi:ABC-type transport system involved in multi-copper enzyme maturation permease subunit
MSLIAFPIFLAVFFGIPILIGVYVYKDAASRRMNAILWTLVAIVAPGLTGFIIYLLVRGDYPSLK